jgi:hypothetical protein
MKPSDHIRAGECPLCHGRGHIVGGISGEREACPLCGLSGTWPPPGDPDEVPTQ